MTSVEALLYFNLAPFAIRRDVAMLGLIHRTVLGKGSKHFKTFFFPAEQRRTANTRLERRRQQHGKQLSDPRAYTHLNATRRSALGLVAVYNLLPAEVVQKTIVKEFQKSLQELVKERAVANCENWAETLSPRVPLYRHPRR